MSFTFTECDLTLAHQAHLGTAALCVTLCANRDCSVLVERATDREENGGGRRDGCELLYRKKKCLMQNLQLVMMCDIIRVRP